MKCQICGKDTPGRFCELCMKYLKDLLGSCIVLIEDRTDDGLCVSSEIREFPGHLGLYYVIEGFDPFQRS